MISSFDREKYKTITSKKCKLSQQDVVDRLYNEYGIEMTIGGVKSWTRTTLNAQGEIFQPNIKTLNALADMCKCSIQDFFSDADLKREQITNEEISKKPDKYSKSISNAFLSTLPKGVDKVIENYLLLTQEQQENILAQMQAMAYENMKF